MAFFFRRGEGLSGRLGLSRRSARAPRSGPGPRSWARLAVWAAFWALAPFAPLAAARSGAVAQRPGAGAAQGAAGPTTRDVLSLARAPGLAFVVLDLKTGRILDSHNAEESFSPASTMKLVTAFSALRALGPGYRYETRLTARAAVEGGALKGNLYWKGNGNPVFDQPDLVALLGQLRDKGVGRIDGSLVLDRSVWGKATDHVSDGLSEDFGSDVNRVFMNPPDPHQIAYKLTWVNFSLAGGKAEVWTEPPLVSYPVVNRLSLSKSGSGRCVRVHRRLRVGFDGSRLNVSGSVPPACDGQKVYVNMLEARQFAAESFAGQWRKLGGVGPAGAREGREPPGAQTLASVESPPLSEIVKLMNKSSNNLIARSLLLTLGQGEEDALQAGRARVRRILEANGVRFRKMFVDNGSGLSRQARVTARSMAYLLYAAYRAPFRDAFVDSLPIAGVDGTLRRRMRGYPLRMKTGTLSGVHALAGYSLPREGAGRPLAIVAIVNDVNDPRNPRGAAARASGIPALNAPVSVDQVAMALSKAYGGWGGATGASSAAGSALDADEGMAEGTGEETGEGTGEAAPRDPGSPFAPASAAPFGADPKLEAGAQPVPGRMPGL